MGRLSVDPDVLRDRARDVDEYAQQIGATPSSALLIATWSAVPSAKLSSKSMDAGAALSDGRKASITRLEDLASALRGAAQDFQGTDEHVNASFLSAVYAALASF